jgi:hypothetical protein
MDEVIFLVSESPEGGYEAKSIANAIFTEADSLDELRSAVREAVSCHYEEADRPKMVRLHFTRDEVFAV